jgi:hypothetical protein
MVEARPFQTAADQFAKAPPTTRFRHNAIARAAEELKKSSESLTHAHQALSAGVTREIGKGLQQLPSGREPNH